MFPVHTKDHAMIWSQDSIV